MSPINDKQKQRANVRTYSVDENLSLNALAKTTFAERLKSVIGECSMTAFANRCNLSESAIRKYIRGDSEPTLPNLLVIAKVGNVSLSWLATGEIDQDPVVKHCANEIHALPSFGIHSDHNVIYEIEFQSLLDDNPKMVPHSQWTLSKKWLNKEGLQNANLAFTALNCENIGRITNYGDIALINIKQHGWHGALEGIFILSLHNNLRIKRIQFDPIKNGYHLCSDHTFYRDHFIKLENFPDFKIVAKIERILMPVL